ncbi:MAG: hypothetical protein V2A73_01255, partial [Pseudomonadota bacterium]
MNEIEVRDHGSLAAVSLEGLVKGLASLDVRPYHLVSLHLDSCWNDEQQRERARLVLKNALTREREKLQLLPDQVAAMLERDLGRAEGYATNVVKQRQDVGFEGIAAFYCESRDIDLAVLAHTSMETRLVVRPRPSLVPLARSASDIDIALIAVAETDEVRILELTVGGFVADSLEAEIPDRVQRGGWRQLRIQKHIADHIKHHHREAARDLLARYDGITALRGRPPRVVLGGREPMLAAFEHHLPDRLLAAAIRAPTLNPKAATTELIES